jgi:hypothetical protein
MPGIFGDEALAAVTRQCRVNIIAIRCSAP